MMADIQEWFVEHEVRNFYSVSISGYHIAEAGANPISQLAFTLANGFTYVEAYLARGHGRRRLRAQPLVLLLQRHGPRVHGARPGRPPHLGRRDARPLRRRRARAEAEVPRADLGPVAARAGDGVQRHPHHAAGADARSTTTPTACTPTPTTRRSPRPPPSRCAGRWPSSSIINREWGLADEREPAAGLRSSSRSSPTSSRRRCSPSSSASASAAACSARWRPATSAAASRTSRCSTSSASTTARCRSSASTPSSTPTATTPTRRRSIELARSTDDEKQRQLDRLRDFQAAPRRRAPGRARPAARRRPRRRQPVRRADGRRARAARSARSPTPSSRSAAATAATSDPPVLCALDTAMRC